MKGVRFTKISKILLKVLVVVFSLLFLLTSCNSSNSKTEDNSSLISSDDLSQQASDVADSEISEESKEESEEFLPPDDGFYILYTEDEVDFSKAPKAEINKYPWNNDYAPYAYGQVVFKKDDGFYVYMYCKESNPKTVITENGGNVYLDSALEFFCDYNPQKVKVSKNYINLEMNSAGVYLAQYNGKPVDSMSDEKITVEGLRRKDYWSVTAHIPLGLIKDVYGDVEIGEGSIVECNFTKCGSGTKIKHWGTWQELSGTSPNFHQPELFAKVQIKK